MKWSHSLAVAGPHGLIGLFAPDLLQTWREVVRRERLRGSRRLCRRSVRDVRADRGLPRRLGVSRLVAKSERPSAPKAAAVSAAALVLTIVAITTTARILADIPPLSEGEQLFLMVEVQTPVGYPSPDTLSGIGHLKLRQKETGPLFKEDVRFVDDRWVIPGAVRVFTSRGGRSLDVAIGEVHLAAFVLRLPAHPGPESREWSEWLPASSGDSRRSGESPRSIKSPSDTELFDKASHCGLSRSVPFQSNSGQCVLFLAVVGASGCPIVFPRQLQRSGLPGFDRFGSVAVLNGPRTALLVQGAARPHGDLPSGRRQRT
jgi:hypothetical protein